MCVDCETYDENCYEDIQDAYIDEGNDDDE